METPAIIWDFDGTILPLAPFDSEQSLLLHRMNHPKAPFGLLKKTYVKAIIYADRRERLRKTFKRSYIRLLRGTPSNVLDEVCRDLAEKISTADRNVFWQLKADGYDMLVLSCGTADLSKRILTFAGLLDCFSRIEGNRFQFDDDRIAGMQLRLPDPEDKLTLVKKLNLSPDRTIVVGDGYTDLPLLNWASIAVMVDRSGMKKKQFISRDFYFISSIPQIMNIIEENAKQRHTKKMMKNKKLIVFDMDGVLIDVSRSYRETVRQTVGIFFKPAPSSEKLPEPLFPLTDLAAVKQSGGLNNDWDLSRLVISLLFNVIEKTPVYERKDPWDRYRETISRCNVGPLAEFLKSTPTPLSALLGNVGKTQNAFINGLYTGDVGSGNIIKQIFQEVYLGKDLFEATYGLAPQFYFDEGFNHREQLLIDKPILEELAANHIVAIATGRPRAEAHYPLDRFGIRKYFASVMALEDCLEEEARLLITESKKISLSKPDPFMLDAIAEGQKDLFAESYYIGDMPDDMIAAKKSASGYKAVGMILSAPDKESLKKELKRAGADTIIENFKQLKGLVQAG